jgi:hypothetical protein
MNTPFFVRFLFISQKKRRISKFYVKRARTPRETVRFCYCMRQAGFQPFLHKKTAEAFSAPAVLYAVYFNPATLCR